MPHLVACSRELVSIEKDAVYFKIASERIGAFGVDDRIDVEYNNSVRNI